MSDDQFMLFHPSSAPVDIQPPGPLAAPDETLSLPGYDGKPVCEIELAHVDGLGWIYGCSYTLNDSEGWHTWSQKRPGRGDSRDDALLRAISSLRKKLTAHVLVGRYDPMRAASAAAIGRWLSLKYQVAVGS